MESNKKRQRTANFTQAETGYLVNIILKYIEILENKKTNSVIWKAKNEAWEKITKEFNCISGIANRTNRTLRLKYDVLKRQMKRKIPEIKLETLETGEGMPTTKKIADWEEKLAQVLIPSIHGLPSRCGLEKEIVMQTIKEYDNASIHDEKIIDEGIEEQYEGRHLKNHDSENSTENTFILRSSQATCAEQEINKKYNKIADDRSELLDIKKKFWYNEEERKKIEHDMQVQIFKKKVEILEMKIQILKKKNM